MDLLLWQQLQDELRRTKWSKIKQNRQQSNPNWVSDSDCKFVTVNQQSWEGPPSVWRHGQTARFEKAVKILVDKKKKIRVDFYHYRVVVYTHCQHTFQFKQLVFITLHYRTIYKGMCFNLNSIAVPESSSLFPSCIWIAPLTLSLCLRVHQCVRQRKSAEDVSSSV